MRAAARRLEELLRDPGPNIIVRRLSDGGAAAEGSADADEAPAEPFATNPIPQARQPFEPPEPDPLMPAARGGESIRHRVRKRSERSAQPEPPAADRRADPGKPAAGSRKGAATRSPPVKAPPVIPAPSPEAARPAKLKQAAPGSTLGQPPQRGYGAVLDWLMPADSEVKAAVAESRSAFAAVGLYSLAINILMLAGPLFMLQVYDRVMTSGSMPTLVALFLITAALYGVIGILELVRTRIIVRIGVEVDQRLGDRVFQASLRHALTSAGAPAAALRELDTLRQFLASQGPITFFDVPWTPIYLIVIALTHWMLGLAAAAGAALLLFIAWASENRSRGPLTEAGKVAARSIELAETGQRNAESITAMGMLGAYRARWQRCNREALSWQLLAADRLGGMSALSKTLRLLMQSVMLAIGAALAIAGDISAGAIIAGTIIFGRALAPVEQVIGHWRGLIKARESYLKLADLLQRQPPPPARTALPSPKARLEVSNLRVAAPETRQLILSNLNFRVEPGQMLAVIGPSASGKSTLARTLVALWAPFSGSVRLDGARLDQWDSEALGRHIGYLPQSVDLFAGTVRENIARFRDEASDEDVVAAARMAHAHDLILALPKGYETELGAFGTYLSAGQRQRIGLARALFGDPALIVLDEPNANLDRLGDEALASAIDGARARGQAVVLVSHRVQAIGKADMLLYLERGVQRAFGPRAEVLKLLQGQAPRGEQGPASSPPASASEAA